MRKISSGGILNGVAVLLLSASVALSAVFTGCRSSATDSPLSGQSASSPRDGDDQSGSTASSNAETGAGAGTAKRNSQQPIAVTVAHVTGRSIQREVQVVGTLWGYEEVEIAGKVGGRIARITHDVGDAVHPGDALLEVEDTDLKLAVDEAQRALELELARLGVTEVPGENFEIRKLPSVARSELLQDRTRSALERTQQLASRRAVTEDQMEQAQTDFKVAESNTRQAVIDAEQTLAAIRARQAGLAVARQRLADARVVVPHPAADSAVWRDALSQGGIEYVVAERRVTEGEMIETMPQTVLFRLVMDRILKLKATVPERHIGQVELNQSVALSVEAYPNETFSGVVARINPTVDHANRTFQIEIHIPNAERRLRSGGFTKARIQTRVDENVPTVPQASLVRFAGVVKVFQVRDDQSFGVPVRTGERLELPAEDGKRAEDWIEVQGDLPIGAAVVVTGHSQLADGTPVRVRGTP